MRRRLWRRLWLMFWLALGAAAGLGVAAAEPLIAWQAPAVRGLGWVDGSGTASLDEAQAAFDSGAGHPVDPSAVVPLGPGVAAWYRLALPPVAQPTRAVLRLAFAGTDRVDLYRPGPGGGWDLQRSGDAVPMSQRPLRHLAPAFVFTIDPGEGPTYMRVANAQPMRVEWTLQDAGSFVESVKGWHLALGAYAGFVAMVVLLSLFNAVSWRDPIHLYYAVHVVLVGLSIMVLTGLAAEYLWPDHAWWTDKAPVVIPGLAFAWVSLLLRELVAERGGKLVSGLLLANVVVSVLLVIGFLVVGRENVYRAPGVYAVPGLAVIVGVVFWFALRRPSVGLWMLGGMLAMALGALLPLLSNLGLVARSFLTDHGPQLGGMVEVPLVLVGLFFRSRERLNSRRRLEAMAHTDPLTGLANHRVLTRTLDQLLRAARRDQRLGAVLRVHVANLNQITGEYGREAGEAALVRAAECAAREAREGDLVAREPASDVVLVLGGHLTQQQLAEAGRNIIARGLKYSGRLPPGVTLKLHVAGVGAPLPDCDAGSLLQALARLLLDIANDPQGRALRFAGSPDTSSWARSSRPHSRPESAQ
ncbi:7TM diverse intracellular signaling domain-containing protein [Ramlibacter sp.]|uniref:7TM diverse intracellular signaling domain-containing protein n=1 Tax=Ramlibacter sp. TaxID=1917967 RepID=UPI002B7A0701|nr:7TM diverse intracellular signaling domain-containing protein [Ramlibacter sp.]HWI80846.1 7TM diverse intracellular signaling domain-containing protein [Ramlibacter sp.]